MDFKINLRRGPVKANPHVLGRRNLPFWLLRTIFVTVTGFKHGYEPLPYSQNPQSNGLILQLFLLRGDLSVPQSKLNPTGYKRWLFAHAKAGYRQAFFKRKSPASKEERAFLFTAGCKPKGSHSSFAPMRVRA